MKGNNRQHAKGNIVHFTLFLCRHVFHFGFYSLKTDSRFCRLCSAAKIAKIANATKAAKNLKAAKATKGCKGCK